MTIPAVQFDAIDEQRHPAGDDPWWQESIAIMWGDLALRAGGVHRIGHEPGFDGGIVAQTFGVFDSDQRFRRNLTEPIADELSPKWFGTPRHSFSVDDGVPRLVIDEPDCSADLRVADLYPLTDFFPKDNASLVDNFAPRHYETSGRITGRLRIGEVTHEIDGWCHRDHSWGRRTWAGALASHRWVPGVINEHLCFGSMVWHGTDGSLGLHGYVLRDGEITYVRRAELIPYLDADGLSIRGGEITMDLGDDTFHATCTPLDANLSFHHDVAWTDTMCRVTYEGQEGWCNFEVSNNPRQGTGPITLVLGANHVDGLTSRPR